MKLSQNVLILTEPIAIVFLAASITLMCLTDFSTASGFWLMLLGIALFAVSISYILWSLNTLINMKVFDDYIERNRKKVLHALTDEYKEFEFSGLGDFSDDHFTNLISSDDNVKCFAKIDENGFIHYKITIEEISRFPAPFAHFHSYFTVPEPKD